MLASLLVLLSVITVRARFDDPDMWWHMKIGEMIWTTHVIPKIDTFSYTTNHHVYIAHEWLSQLTIYGAYRLGSYTGLMLWLCIATSALLIAGYGLCSLYSRNSKVAFFGAIVLWLFATSGLAIRPQMVGYLLLIFELLLIHLGRTRSPNWFFCLPPLFCLWINCHGSFLFGMAVAFIFLFSSFFEFQAGSLVARRWDKRTSRMFAYAVGLSLAALWVCPSGMQQILYPINMMWQQPVAASQIAEWQPLELTGVRGIAFLGVVGFISLIVIVRRSDLFLHELLLLAAASWVSVGHRRMIFVFGILAAPILSRLLSDSWETYDSDKDKPLVNALFILGSLLAVCMTFPNRQSLSDQVDKESPVRAVDFIKSRHLSGPILNDFEYGGYLIWAAPEHPVFVDGRADVFDWTGVLGQFGSWATLQSNPRDLLDRYRVTFCLLTKHSPMVKVLPLLAEWKMAYSDQNSVIFMRVGSPQP
jgi:hypothetical protein